MNNLKCVDYYSFVAVVLSVIIGVINYESGLGLPEEIIDAIVIFAIVIAVVVLGFIEEYRSEKSLAALKKMAALTATVIRDNTEMEIPSREIVPGDIVILNTGDKIPADLRLVEAFNLSTLEAPLTGESTPVEKITSPIQASETAIGDRINMAFSGTTVTYGRGKGIATGTGMQTEFGKIASMLQELDEEMTPLQENLAKVGKWIAFGCLGIVAVIVALQLILTRQHSILEMFITGREPGEGRSRLCRPSWLFLFPSVFKNGETPCPRAPSGHTVETLGSTSVIFSDKTGTLTQDKMTVRKIYADGSVIDISGTGYEPKGEFRFESKPQDISLNTAVQMLVRASALCNDTSLVAPDSSSTSSEGTWGIKGDPTEGALVVLSAKAGLSKEDANKRFPRVDEIPFSSERKKMTTIHTTPEGKAFLKAPEIILTPALTFWRQRYTLTESDRAAILNVATQMAEMPAGAGYKPTGISTELKRKDDAEKRWSLSVWPE
jgi:Ca2+-transporting ATPase